MGSSNIWDDAQKTDKDFFSKRTFVNIYWTWKSGSVAGVC